MCVFKKKLKEIKDSQNNTNLKGVTNLYIC